MSVVPKDFDKAEFLFHFGQFIIVWNHLEIAARDVLSWLTGKSVTAQILSYQIGNASLTDAVRISADWHPTAKQHMLHFVKLMDTIRPYRNYYVHNLIGVAPEVEHGETIGIVIALNVRGKYVLHEKALKVADLKSISNHTDTARKYGLKTLDGLKITDLRQQIEFFASLEMPPLPETLEKHVRDPQAP